MEFRRFTLIRLHLTFRERAARSFAQRPQLAESGPAGAGQSSAQAKHGSELCSETAACPLQLVSFVFMGVDEDGVGVGPMETEPVTAPAAAMQTRPEAPMI